MVFIATEISANCVAQMIVEFSNQRGLQIRITRPEKL
jgi:hypothetical protein